MIPTSLEANYYFIIKRLYLLEDKQSSHTPFFKEYKMKIIDILNSTTKPEIYTKSTANMWTDEYISKQLLDVHLNEELDLASRKKTTIDKTID
tara:strand:+ start:994 stop:1272 length:279 start_codon:yes stop_codon:yes gene_type:complete